MSNDLLGTTHTGRLARGPNMQGLPMGDHDARKIRDAFTEGRAPDDDVRSYMTFDQPRDHDKASRDVGSSVVTVNEDAHGDDCHRIADAIVPNVGVAMAANAAVGLARHEAAARGEIMGKAGLTTKQKNEIISALDGVMQNQGNEDEQVQIAVLVAVLAAGRLLKAARPYASGQENRSVRIRLARNMAANFESSLRKLVREL